MGGDFGIDSSGVDAIVEEIGSIAEQVSSFAEGACVIDNA